MNTFELWSYDVSGKLGQYAEHTYIKCPDNHTYFDCWGDHNSPTQGSGNLRFSCQGIYAVADCYRDPVPIIGIHDTAGIGVYGVNGVCHQTANLFLYSSGRAIAASDGVKGYILSSYVYGVYGDFAPVDQPDRPQFLADWKRKYYDVCYRKIVDGGTSSAKTLFQDLAELHKSIVKGLQDVSHELIHKEAALLTKHAVPDIDTDVFKDIHLDFLKEKIEMIKSGLRGGKLANGINAAAANFQKSLANKIGGDAYKTLTGLEPGETMNIVDPEIAERAAHK